MEGIMLDENKARRVKFWVKFQDLETIRNYSDFNVWKEHWSELLDVPSDFTGGSNPAWFRLHPHPHPKSLNQLNVESIESFFFFELFFFVATSNFRLLILRAARVGGEAGHWNIQDAMRLVKSVLSPGLSALSPQVGWGQRAWKGLDPLPFEKRDVFMYWIEPSWVEVRKKMQKLSES